MLVPGIKKNDFLSFRIFLQKKNLENRKSHFFRKSKFSAAGNLVGAVFPAIRQCFGLRPCAELRRQVAGASYTRRR